MRLLALLVLTMLVAFALVPAGAFALTSGPEDAGTGTATGTGTAWANPGNITAAGTPYTTATNVPYLSNTNTLRATNYGFDLPADAVIDGISVTINRQSTGMSSPYIRDLVVQLTKNGTAVVGSNLAVTGTDWPTAALGTASYGGTSNLWGTTWTAAEVNASTFGVHVQARNANTNSGRDRTATIDYVRVTVTYHVPADTTAPTVVVSSPSSNATLTSSSVTVSGTAADTESSISTVSVTIQRSSDSLYWTGSDWGAQTWLGVTGTTSWTGTYAITPEAQDGSPTYSIVARAVDSATNTGTAAAVTGVKIRAYNVDYYASTGGGLLGTAHQVVGWGQDSSAVTAIANPGYTFIAWSDLVLTAARQHVAVTADTSATALFAKNVTVTASASDKSYDGTDTAQFELSSADLDPSDDVTITATGASFADKHAAEDKLVTVSGLELSGADAYKYILVSQTATTTASIDKLPLEVTAATDSKTYDGTTDSDGAPTITSGALVAGDEATWDQTFDTAAVGTGKTLTASGEIADEASGDVTGDYDITFVDDTTGEISLRAITVSATTQTKVYDGTTDATAVPTITSGTLADGESGDWSQAYDSAAVGDPKTLTPSGTVSGAGDVDVTDNYDITFSDVSGAITPATVTVTADDKSKTYGDDDPAFTFDADGFIGTDTWVTEPTGAVAGDHANAGDYDIDFSGGDAGSNYEIDYVAGTLTVDPATLSATAEDKSKTYGDDDPAFTFKTDGFIGTDTWVTEPTCEVTGVHEAVGDYQIDIAGGDAGSNYTIDYFAGQLTINRRAVTVTADDTSKIYGTDDPALTYKLSTGTLVGDDEFTGSLTRDAGEDVGDYAIEQGTLALSANYDVTFEPGTFSITPATITVTADDKDKTYGDDDPAFTFDAQGFVGTDGWVTEPTGAVAGDHVDVGDYDIDFSGGDAGENYEIDYVAGTLSVAARAITVTAQTDERTYDGTTDSAETPVVTAGTLATGDVGAWSQSFDTADAGTGKSLIPTGTVADATTRDVTANYDITFADRDTGVVNQATVTVTADDQSKPWGEPDPDLTFKTDGFFGSDTWVTEPVGQIADPHVDMGDYDITFSGGDAGSNYKVEYVKGTLTITLPRYDVVYVAGDGGTIDGDASQWVEEGSDATTVTAVPDAGYSFVKWSDDLATAQRCDRTISADATYTAVFSINSYTIDASATAGGSVTSTGTPEHGNTVVYTFAPRSGYRVSNVVVDGTSVGAWPSWTFSGLDANHTLSVSFVPATEAVRRYSSSDVTNALNLAKARYPKWKGVKHLVVATSSNTYQTDAIAASALAGAYQCPVILVPSKTLPASLRSAIDAMPSGLKVHIVGDRTAVTTTVARSIDSIPGVSVDRTYGVDRYATTAAVARKMKTVLGAQMGKEFVICDAKSSASWDDMWVASAAAAGARHVPVLLVQGGKIPASTASAITDLGLTQGYILGTTSAVPETVRTALAIDSQNRVGNSDRYARAATFARLGKARGWFSGRYVGFAKYVESAPTAGAYCGSMGSPMLFTFKGAVPSATAGYLAQYKAIIGSGALFGSTNAVTETTRKSLQTRIR